MIFGTGVSAAAPGSVEGLHLVVFDIEAERAELVGRGIDVSELFHDEGGVFLHAGTEGRATGPRPGTQRRWLVCLVQRPGRHGWVLQEINQRLPGR